MMYSSGIVPLFELTIDLMLQSEGFILRIKDNIYSMKQYENEPYPDMNMGFFCVCPEI